MDPRMRTIFEPLRHAIEARPYTASDFMKFLGGLVATDPGIARAACLHASDIFEVPNYAGTRTYACVIAEVYRRVFFDRMYAVKYGTTQVLDAGEEVCRQFVLHLIDGLASDDHQDNAGSFHPAATNQ